MKKVVFILILVAVVFLCSCGKKEDIDRLVLPKTTWGMSVQEVLDAYGITKEDTIMYEEMHRAVSFGLEDYELFGKAAFRTWFSFVDTMNNGNMELGGITVQFSEDTDMEHVLDNMKKAYGKTVPEFKVYHGMQVFDTLDGEEYTDSDSLKLWASRPVADFIPEKEYKEYGALWKDHLSTLNEENWDEFAREARMVTVACWYNASGNQISFDAYNLLIFNELKKQVLEGGN